MDQGFVIMKIGNPELDKVYYEVFEPTLDKCGLNARRVDKHNKGGLLKSEIIKFIDDSPIIIADLTDERPNCYLEVGYAMGVGKLENLILTARQDHNQDHPDHQQGGPKVHFDLIGYDVLFWAPDNFGHFCAELEKRIRRRLSIISETPAIQNSDDYFYEWISNNSETAISGSSKHGLNGFMEAYFFPTSGITLKNHKELFDAAKNSEILTFGFPLAAVLDGDLKPAPTTDSICAEILSKTLGPSYNYWALNSGGCFYMLESFFEDSRQDSTKIYFNTRIVRVTELLLYCLNIYQNLGYDLNTNVKISVKHQGLKNRTLGATESRIFRHTGTSNVDVVSKEMTASLHEIDTNMLDIVKFFIEPLFILFDYFELPDVAFKDIIENFKIGKVI